MVVKLGFDRQFKEDSGLVEEPTSFIYFSQDSKTEKEYKFCIQVDKSSSVNQHRYHS